MRISIIGSGYVGLCTAVGFASKGHEVICVDIDEEKVKKINNSETPIFEENLENMLKDAISKKLLYATTNINDAIINSDISFITVGTPSMLNGDMSLEYIKKASEDIGNTLEKKNSYHVIVVKSTVLPETTEKIIIPIIEKDSGKIVGRNFGICMNPEFLREGKAISDFINPDRIVIGEYDKKTGDILEKLYKDFDSPIIRTSLKTAEMIKYASNAFLATKISFINEIGNICKKLGIDTNEVAKAMGLDKRISPHFLESGIGFGGSCFPKDVSALINKAKKINYESKLLETVIDINRNQPEKIVEILLKKMDIKGKKIAVLGLAFKPKTDDIRDSPAISVINSLMNKGAKIYAYDPKAELNAKKIIPDINYCKSIGEALDNSDACLILTDWPEFKSLSDKDFSRMNKKIIIEGRKVLENVDNFEGVCW